MVNGSVANLVWAGGQNANAWDVKTTTNWTGGGDSLFWNADQVTFNDSTANTTVNIAPSAVLPGTITVDTAQNYTFTGTGIISGGATLTKKGTGTLTISTANDFTGATSIEAGKIILGSATALRRHDRYSNNSKRGHTGPERPAAWRQTGHRPRRGRGRQWRDRQQ